MIGILIVAAVGIIGFLLTAGIAFGIAGSYQIDSRCLLIMLRLKRKDCYIV